ncbi:hypothetical protein B0H12DRAFT_1131520 [Mycena haematopus]|nr:hypothetical protein B0H12DRAFT_1131520 [Mycena haematopus]
MHLNPSTMHLLCLVASVLSVSAKTLVGIPTVEFDVISAAHFSRTRSSWRGGLSKVARKSTKEKSRASSSARGFGMPSIQGVRRSSPLCALSRRT